MTHDNGAYVKPIGTIFNCRKCGAYSTILTEVHQSTEWCTGCLLRELRPFDFTVPNAR